MRVQSPVKQILAIHDISGYGRTSLSVVIPILSTMGVKVCSLPTALLSSHSQYQDYYFVDLTEHMTAILEHWKKLKTSFDVIYSGFLGSHKQICIVEDIIKTFGTKEGFVVIDPVLGDNGKLYKSISEQIVVEMRALIKNANIITPNLTELFFLLGQDYDMKISEQKIKEMMLKLADAGPEIVVVTSAPDTNARRKFSVLAYNKNENRFWKVPIDYIPADFPGTGDCFTSVLTGALMQGDSLPIALDRAVSFISYGVRATFGYKHDQNEGILLEKILDRLNTPMPISSYEII
ncbi:MAG: pyridoxamine kinase [Bacteroidales bacterium]|nr:pyridoxamine kinase [Bacteroidales bacterium]